VAGEEVPEDRGRLIRKGAETTMISTHVLNRTLGVRSPADVLWRPGLTGRPDHRRRALQSNTPAVAIPPSHQLKPGEIVPEPPEDVDDDF
jgi:hypothetical protein